MKIAHFTHHFLPCIGGVEKVVLEYCKGALDNGINARVVCLNRCPNSRKILLEKESIQGIRVERLPFIDLKYYKIAFGTTKKISDADILHVHGLGFFSDLLLLFKPLHKKKIVLTTYGGVFHTKNLSALKKIYFFLWNKWLLGKADKIIAISENDFELFSRIIPRERLVLMEIGADAGRFAVISGKRRKNSFLFLGRLAKNKGLEELVNAFSIVAQKKKNAKLFIVGKDFDGTEEKLKGLINGFVLQENVLLVGEKSEEELSSLLAETEFFVSASKYESFGISAVEAMAAGLIPILSGIKQFRKFVEDGKNGFIVDFSDKENAGRKILEISALDDNKRKEISLKARESAKRHSWGGKAMEVVRLYQGLTQESASGKT